jgi:hypothetical protein
MDELQALIEKLQRQSGSSVVDLRYRPEEEAPNWAVIIDWGNKYMAAVQDTPIDSLKAALLYLENQQSENSSYK